MNNPPTFDTFWQAGNLLFLLALTACTGILLVRTRKAGFALLTVVNLYYVFNSLLNMLHVVNGDLIIGFLKSHDMLAYNTNVEHLTLSVYMLLNLLTLVGWVLLLIQMWNATKAPRAAQGQASRTAQPPAPPTCPHCGTPRNPGDRFCTHCGVDIVTAR